jgi:hypothetical protein
MHSVLPCAAPVANVKMTEPSKVLHIRNVGPEISEVRILAFLCTLVYTFVWQWGGQTAPRFGIGWAMSRLVEFWKQGASHGKGGVLVRGQECANVDCSAGRVEGLRTDPRKRCWVVLTRKSGGKITC